MKLDEIESIAKATGAKVIMKVRADVLANYCRLLGSMSDQVLMTLDQRGLYCATVDPAHISLIETLLPKDRFEVLTNEDNYQFALDVDTLGSYLKDLGNELVLFIIEDKNRLVLNLHTTNTSFTTNGVEPAGLKQPSTNIFDDKRLVAQTNVNAGRFAKAMKLGSTLRDHLAVVMHQNDAFLDLEFMNDNSSLRISLQPQTLDTQKIRMAQARSLFPNEYLQSILEAIPETVSITVQLGTDYPIVLTWHQFDIDVKAAVAPRIESED